MGLQNIVQYLLILAGTTSVAEAAPPPPSGVAVPSLTQKGSGLTQNNTSGLSQNMMGRSATQTDVSTAPAPIVLYPGVSVPATPQELNVGPSLVSSLPSQATTTNTQTQIQIQPAPAVESGRVMPEAPSNE